MQSVCGGIKLVTDVEHFRQLANPKAKSFIRGCSGELPNGEKFRCTWTESRPETGKTGGRPFEGLLCYALASLPIVRSSKKHP